MGSRWLARANLPVARGYVPATTIGGVIYTGGGAAITAATLTDTVESFTYNPGTNTWAPIANMPRATGETRAVAMNGEMWVLGGGRIAPNPSNQVDIYNPGSNTWSTGLPFTNGTAQLPGRQRRDRAHLARWRVRGHAAVVNTTQVFGQGVCPTPTPSPTPGTPTPTPTRHARDTEPDGNSERDGFTVRYCAAGVVQRRRGSAGASGQLLDPHVRADGRSALASAASSFRAAGRRM